jgi:serine/threonine-protein kinase
MTVSIRGYDVWGRLGGGGMSDVWLAKHVALSVPVVVKTIRSDVRDVIGSQVAEKRLLEEARLMARVKNPRVVRATDAGVTDDTPYLVEEYVDGIDLAELDKRRRTAIGVGLPLWFVATVMRETCDALHSAHQAGVIHRDVKPSNVFGSPDGIRLGDFGIAVVQSKDEKRESSGTVRFMAPEQFGGVPFDRRVDVWGAGATACDLRYGRVPFDTVDDILAMDREPRMPAAATPEEAFFQHTLRSMLKKDPEQRLANCADAGRRFASLARSLTPTSYGALPVDRHALRIGPCVIFFEVGDIADSKADAIINSAYYSMSMRSGVGEALRKRGGDEIEAEALASGEQPLGSCIVTKAGKLRAKHVLHAVSAWNEVSCVGRAVARALLTADELGCRTVAMPALGTGLGRVSIEMCAHSTIRALRWRALLGGMRAREFYIYLTDEERRRVFQEVAEEALQDIETQSPMHDFGLPHSEAEVRAEGATCLDASSTSDDT